MAISRQTIADAARTLLGISAYIPAEPMVPEPPNAETLRVLAGGQIQPILSTKTRWYMADLEQAAIMADGGNLSMIGKLCRSMRRDGMISGLMSTRTSGLVSLPKRFSGDEKIVAELTAENGTRTLFDEMFPPSELALLAADGIGVGVGVAELVPVKGREHPVMVRLEPEFLQYRQHEGRWYYQSMTGTLPITPGDGRWVLHTPGGALNPWTYGEWHSLGRAFITKEHAFLHRANYSAKLANPARVGIAPPNASEDQRISFIAKLLQWGLNTAFAMPVGWDVKLLESNGRGWEVFDKEVDSSNLEVMITLAGQVVTVTGGTGFANADIHKTIRADLIKQTGLSLAHTVNTQGIPPYVYRVHGRAALERSPRLRYETDPPDDLKVAADAADSFGRGVKSANEALRPYDKQLDIEVMATRHSLPLADRTVAGPTLPEAEAAKVVTVDEARESQGLESKGDDRMLQELTDAAKTEAAEVQADAKTDVAKMAPTPAPKALRRNRLSALGGAVLLREAGATRMRAGGEFDESKHPRSDDGKFGEGGGGGGGDSSDDDSDDEAPERVDEKYISGDDLQFDYTDVVDDFPHNGDEDEQIDHVCDSAKELAREFAPEMREVASMARAADKIIGQEGVDLVQTVDDTLDGYGAKVLSPKQISDHMTAIMLQLSKDEPDFSDFDETTTPADADFIIAQELALDTSEMTEEASEDAINNEFLRIAAEGLALDEEDGLPTPPDPDGEYDEDWDFERAQEEWQSYEERVKALNQWRAAVIASVELRNRQSAMMREILVATGLIDPEQEEQPQSK